MAQVVLRAGHVRPVWAGHPWVFAQGVSRLLGPVAAGSEVQVLDPEGNVLGRGLYSPESAIRVRLYTREAEEHMTTELIVRRLEQALARRARFGLPDDESNALRILNGEGDGLPGLIVDQLGSVTTLQFLTLGMKQRQDSVLQAIQAILKPEAIVDRTPARTAKKEGFVPGTGIIAGNAAVDTLRFSDCGTRFEVPLTLGQKTGYYLDLRALRRRLALLAQGKRVLDCFAYIGAAGLSMARGGAEEVLSIESSHTAVEVGQRCVELNEASRSMRIEQGDARHALAEAAAAGGYDLVICDPPKFMPRRSAYQKAERAMQTLTRAAARATRPGGLLVVCSCSAGLGLPELGRALAIGSRQAGRQATVMERIYQDIDHPVPAAFPEGLYLSSIVAQIDLDR